MLALVWHEGHRVLVNCNVVHCECKLCCYKINIYVNSLRDVLFNITILYNTNLEEIKFECVVLCIAGVLDELICYKRTDKLCSLEKLYQLKCNAFCVWKSNIFYRFKYHKSKTNTVTMFQLVVVYLCSVGVCVRSTATSLLYCQQRGVTALPNELLRQVA